MAGTEPHAWGTGQMDDIIYVGRTGFVRGDGVRSSGRERTRWKPLGDVALQQPMQLCQHHRVATIRLDPVADFAALFGNERIDRMFAQVHL